MTERSVDLAAHRRLQRLVGWSGLAVALLFGAGNGLWAFQAPRPGASSREIVDFYEQASRRIIVGDSISMVAIALFAFFASGFRRMLSEAERDELLATAGFGGALLAAGAGLGAETINMVGALRARDGTLDRALGRSVFETSQILGYNAAGVGLAAFALSTAAVALRAGAILPRWLAAAAGIMGLVLLTPLCRVAFGPAVVLLAAISARLVRTPQVTG